GWPTAAPTRGRSCSRPCSARPAPFCAAPPERPGVGHRGTMRALMDRTDEAPSRSTATARLRSLFGDLFDPYRPELHYMRGPGPRWREKHGVTTAAVAVVDAVGLRAAA